MLLRLRRTCTMANEIGYRFMVKWPEDEDYIRAIRWWHQAELELWGTYAEILMDESVLS